MAEVTPGGLGDEVDDAAVDALRPQVSPGPGRLRIQAGVADGDSGGLRVLENLIALSDMDDLLLLADGLASGEPATRAVDGGGIQVAGGAAEVWDAGSHTLTVGRAALARFMAKALTLAAESVGDPDLAGRLSIAAKTLGG